MLRRNILRHRLCFSTIRARASAACLSRRPTDPQVSSHSGIKNTARRIAVCQGVLALVAGGVAGIAGSQTHMQAALLGGLMAILPMLMFGFRVGITPAGASPREALAVIYKGELVKWVLTLLLCAAAITLFGALFWVTLLTFAGCQGVYWIALARNW